MTESDRKLIEELEAAESDDTDPRTCWEAARRLRELLTPTDDDRAEAERIASDYRYALTETGCERLTSAIAAALARRGKP